MNAAIQAARDALKCDPQDPFICEADNPCRNHQVLAAEQERLLAGHGLPDGCGGCGGPHRFDTSVPSVLWNRVIREQGLSEYLCTACIVREFAKAGVSFTATLWGDGVDGIPIAVEVNGGIATAAHELDEENSHLRAALSAIQDRTDAALGDAQRGRPMPQEQVL